MTTAPPSSLARHFLAEYYGCDRARLDDPAFLEECVRGAARAARTTLLQVLLHKFAPQGVSGLAVLAESHLAVHTWPEHGFAAIEVFMCGAATRPELGHEYLLERLRPAHAEVRVLERGDPALLARYPGPSQLALPGRP